MTKNILIAVLRNDLSLHDHPIFHYCADPTPSSGVTFTKPITHVLPIYVWDQRQIEVGALPLIQKAGRSAGASGKSQLAQTRLLGLWRCGPHRIPFLVNSVFDLRDRLRARNSDLAMYAGTPEAVVPALVKSIQSKGDSVEAIWMGKEVNTEEVNVEKRLKSLLVNLNCPLQLQDGKSLIFPQDLGFPVSNLPDVFTQFRKRVERPEMFRAPLPAPSKLKPFPTDLPDLDDALGIYAFSHPSKHVFSENKQALLELLLEPLLKQPMLAQDLLRKHGQSGPNAFPFSGGETEALERLERYFAGGANSLAAKYKQTRNQMLGPDYSTKFAAALSHGLLSPRLIAHHAHQIDRQNNVEGQGGGYWIVFELLWRDYFYFVGHNFGSKLFTLGGIQQVMTNSKSTLPYKWNQSSLSTFDPTDPFVRWTRAQTGIPFIDANMTELVQTGFMSNRGRQNVASFLTKDLTWDWRYGAEFFEAYLIDYDASSNWGNWQYVAGVGNDPRSSRQFNPIKQAKDYDPNAEYIHTWLPQLHHIPVPHVYHPWTTVSDTHHLLDGYPSRPIVEQPMWKRHYPNHTGQAHKPRAGGRRGGGGASPWRGRGHSRGGGQRQGPSFN